MKRGGSKPEMELLSIIQETFSDARKHTIRKLKIENKLFIRWFELDIFIPTIMKGIEFDGRYSHSFKCMRNDPAKRAWSNDDICNYHEIKDAAFLSHGISVIHIKEEDWLKDKNTCIKKCLDFLKP
jgi:hypothetical protein